MLAHTTWLIAKTDPLKYIFEKPALTGQIMCWQMALSKYDIVYTSQGYVGLETDSDKWKLWFDGASNLLGNEIGAVLASPKGWYFPFWARLGFDYTNNMAKYKACAMGITIAIEHQIKKLKVFGDSMLVIYLLRGEWETRDSKLIPYHIHVIAIGEHFDEISFHYIQ
ncbi:hypothetical protein CR513_57161, partial [Mucuna pruriens]